MKKKNNNDLNIPDFNNHNYPKSSHSVVRKFFSNSNVPSIYEIHDTSISSFKEKNKRGIKSGQGTPIT